MTTRRLLFRIFGLLCWPLAIWCGIVSAAPLEQTKLYFPLLYSGRTDGLGLHIEIGGGPGNQVYLSALQPKFVRNIFGDDQGLNVHQVWKTGGWSAVDAMVLPDLNSIATYSTAMVEFTYGGVCKVPTLVQLAGYADFIVEFVVRYDIKYFSIWNEPENALGESGLFGCFGKAYTSRLIYLAEQVRETLPAGHLMGVSFQMGHATHFTMFQAVVPYLDWVGVHHYGVWTENGIQEPYPGTIQDLYELVTPQSIPVYLTETNLRDDNTICSPQFREDQAEYNKNTMYSDFPVKIILVYAGGNSWQCTGIKGSVTEDMLLTLPQLWIWDK